MIIAYANYVFGLSETDIYITVKEEEDGYKVSRSRLDDEGIPREGLFTYKTTKAEAMQEFRKMCNEVIDMYTKESE